MSKTLQQIKDEYAESWGHFNWEEFKRYESILKVSEGYDQIAIRYAQSQTQQLQEWKESMMTIHNELDLQGIGKVLGLPLGSSIAPQILPKVKELVEQNKDMLEMLEQCEQWIGNCNQYASILKVIDKLINKHKGGKS